MLTITYHERFLLFVPGKPSLLELNYGTSPSFGYFQALATDIDTFLATPGDLQFTFTNGDKLIFKDMYCVSATSDGTSNKYYEIILADSRCFWPLKLGTQDFNLYPSVRAQQETEYTLLCQDTSGPIPVPWTFEKLLLELPLDVEFEFDDSITSRKSQVALNIVGRCIPGNQTLCQVLEQMQCYIVPKSTQETMEYITTTTYLSDTYIIYGIGISTEADRTIPSNSQFLPYLTKQQTLKINPDLLCGGMLHGLGACTRDWFQPSMPVSDRVELKTLEAIGTSGQLAIDLPLILPTPDDSKFPSSLQTKATEFLARYKTGFLDEQTIFEYGGIQPLRLSSYLQKLRWLIDPETNTFLSRAETLSAREKTLPLKDYFNSADRYAFVSGGSIRVAYCKTAAGSGNTIACYLDTDGTGQEVTVYCRLIKETNLSGCRPYLTDGLPIDVAYFDGQWRCLWPFNGAGPC